MTLARNRKAAGFAKWVMVVKENLSEYEKIQNAVMRSSVEVHELLRERALSEDVERMYVICLDGQNRMKYLHEVSRGGLHGCAVAPRDILRIVIMAASSAFVLVHNHPSGDPTPSREDVVMTKTIAEAAKVVGVELVDHVIIGGWNKHTSMYNLGLLEVQ